LLATSMINISQHATMTFTQPFACQVHDVFSSLVFFVKKIANQNFITMIPENKKKTKGKSIFYATTP